MHEFYVDDFLVDRGLTNYWGYNSIGFFAPESSYSTGSAPGCQVDEFKTLVRELHRAGIKVILDVVFNHTGEGNEMGPTMSFRGIDNPGYYILDRAAGAAAPLLHELQRLRQHPELRQPRGHPLVMDSLRYWVQDMHVDGFRFDLASVLGRTGSGDVFASTAPFFDACASRIRCCNRDPDRRAVGHRHLSGRQLPGRLVGVERAVPRHVRRFAKGDAGQLADLGRRLTGSADLYGDDGRSAYNSINFVTCHDGFTLHDLRGLQRQAQRGQRRGQPRRLRRQQLVELRGRGRHRRRRVLALRRQLVKNHFCALLFASGTPMMLGGDEFLRTQRGNNNAYCQDNAISWFDWSLAERNADLVDFVKTGDRDDAALPGAAAAQVSVGRRPRRRPHSRSELVRPGRRRAPLVQSGGAHAVLSARHRRHPAGRRGEQPVLHPQRRLRVPVDRAAAAAGAYGWHRIIDTSLPSGQDFAEP